MANDYAQVPVEELPRTKEDVLARISAMLAEDVNSGAREARHLVRMLMRGNKEAVDAVLGTVLGKKLSHLPSANLFATHLERFGQKIGGIPDLQVHPPSRGLAEDRSDTAAKRAEKKARIVRAFDDVDEVDLTMPQLSMWLPGYQYIAAAVVDGITADGFHYPKIEFFDSYGVVLGAWDTVQTSPDMAVIREIKIRDLVARYPAQAESLRIGHTRGANGAVILGASNDSQNIIYIEYFDVHGRWLLVPGKNILLDYIANPVKDRPQFVVGRAPTFAGPTGSHAHSLGLLQTIARQSLMREKQMLDAVNSDELWVAGAIESNGGVPMRGGRRVNFMSPGSTVTRLNHNVPYQIFDHLRLMVDDLRTTLNYPVSDDGKAPSAWSTGEGIEKLQDPGGRQVAQLQNVLARFFQKLDSIRLEADERTNSNQRKPLSGTWRGARYTETYIPADDIRGDYRTERGYGFLATLDEPQRQAVIHARLAANTLDLRSAVGMMEGADASQVISNLREDKAIEALIAMAGQAAMTGQPPAPPAVRFHLAMVQDTEFRKWVTEFLLPPEEQEGAEAPVPPAMPPGPPPPDVFAAFQQMQAGAPPGAPPGMPPGIPPELAAVMG